MCTGIPLVSLDGNDKVKIHEEAIQQVFNNENIRDLPVCVISICGPPQTGKSLLLDFFFRYARRRNAEAKVDEFKTRDKSVVSIQEQGDEEDESLERSKWKNVTNGILLWPEILVCLTFDKRQMAIIFLETQGAFDDAEDNWRWMNMFVLSTLISCIQIINLTSDFKEKDIKLLDVFYDYGQTLKDMTGRHALQKVQFAVRDWKDTRKANFGAWGGYNTLQKILKNRRKAYPNEFPIIKRMQVTFLEVGSILLPHPGHEVIENPDLTTLSDFNEIFVDYVDDMVRLCLSSKNIVQKEVCGQQLLTRDVENYLRTYVAECMTKPEIPSSASLVIASSKASHDVARDETKYLYTVQMMWVCSGRLQLSSIQLKREHDSFKEVALNHFMTKPKIGGEAFTAKYKLQVEEALYELYRDCARNNWVMRIKHYLVDRWMVLLLLLTFGLSATAAVFDYQEKKELMKYFFAAAQFCAVLLLTYLGLRYRRV